MRRILLFWRVKSIIEIPSSFRERMKAQLDQEYEYFEQVLQSSVPVSIRVNSHKVSEPPFDDVQSIPWHDRGYYLSQRPSFTADPLFHGGAYYVQEASSMMLYHFVNFTKPQIILDLCAAPGGKSTLLAASMREESLLVTNEVIASRAQVLRENMIRWGNPNIIVTQSDPKVFGNIRSTFDTIVVDAPCSGEGMFRKDPAVRKNWSQDQVFLCSSRQRRIVADVLPALKAGGSLIYCTCTFSEEENEGTIRWLLSEFSDQLMLDPVPDLGRFGAEAVTIQNIAHAAYRCYPHRMRGEGMFFCRLTKRQNIDKENIEEISKGKSRKKKVKHNQQPNNSLKAEVQSLAQAFLTTYLGEHDPSRISTYKDQLMYVPHDVGNIKAKGLYILQQGIPLGTIHRKEITPSHELALSQLIHPDSPAVELSREEAIRYLQRETLTLPHPTEGSWILATYKGIKLGWMKKVKRQFKNHLPISWRIRNKIV